jgi:hypothetical protein
MLDVFGKQDFSELTFSPNSFIRRLRHCEFLTLPQANGRRRRI